MSGFWRALLISAIATGAAAVVLKALKLETTAPPPPAAGRPGPYVDAEGMTAEERDLLMQELERQV